MSSSSILSSHLDRGNFDIVLARKQHTRPSSNSCVQPSDIFLSRPLKTPLLTPTPPPDRQISFSEQLSKCHPWIEIQYFPPAYFHYSRDLLSPLASALFLLAPLLFPPLAQPQPPLAHLEFLFGTPIARIGLDDSHQVCLGLFQRPDASPRHPSPKQCLRLRVRSQNEQISQFSFDQLAPEADDMDGCPAVLFYIFQPVTYG